jgi:hypothetical protein
VQIGEPTASTHMYENFVKAAPGSLFKYQGQLEKYKSHIPKYPDKVYDYFHVNRFVLVNGAKGRVKDWNEGLAVINGDLGAKKQVNIVVVLVNGLPSDFFYALTEAWVGGKKNDMIAVVGVDDKHKPQWARVMAWTTDKVIEVKLRDATMSLDTINPDTYLPVLREQVSKFYKRKPMHDFEYLRSSIEPTTTQIVVSMLVELMVALGLAWFFHREDPFGDEGPRRRRRRRYY